MTRGAGRPITPSKPPGDRRPGGFLAPAWITAALRFLNEKRRDGCSVATVDAYRWMLLGGRTEDWRAKRGIDRPSDLTAEDVEGLLAAVERDGLSRVTGVTYRRALRAFARWCGEQEWDGLDPSVTGMHVEAFGYAEVRVITPEEEARLLAAVRCPRDAFFIRFLLATGLRLGEALRLTLDDIVEGESGQVILVRGSGQNKARHLGLGDMKAALRQYIREVRPKDTRCTALFLTTRRDSDTRDYAPLAEQSVCVLLGRLARLADVPHCNARALRNTWAMRHVDADTDLRVLRRAGGWQGWRGVWRFVPPFPTAEGAWVQHQDGRAPMRQLVPRPPE